jgi:hypothetical protein
MLVLASVVASAQEEDGAIRVRIAIDAPSGCIGTDELGAMLAELSDGHLRTGDDPDVELRVVIREEARGHSAEVSLIDPASGETPPRPLVSSEDDCRRLDEPIALVGTLALDAWELERRIAAPPPEPEPEARPPPRPVRPLRVPAVEPPGVRAGVAARGELGFAFVPGIGLAPMIEGIVVLGRAVDLTLALGAILQSERLVDAERGGEFNAWTIDLGAGLRIADERWWFLRALLGARLAIVLARGVGLTNDGDAGAYVPAARVGAAIGLRLGAFELPLEVGLDVPVLHATYAFRELDRLVEVYEAPTLAPYVAVSFRVSSR